MEQRWLSNTRRSNKCSYALFAFLFLSVFKHKVGLFVTMGISTPQASVVALLVLLLGLSDQTYEVKSGEVGRNRSDGSGSEFEISGGKENNDELGNGG